MTWKHLLAATVIIAGGYAYLERNPDLLQFESGIGSSTDQRLAEAYENRQSNLQIRGIGVVSRVLPDDNDGSRHQKFILRLDSGQTVLISHNIDVAPRVDSLRVGDVVEFHGEYEWNDLGGVVHWTHHDPAGRHTDGWLKHLGRVYR